MVEIDFVENCSIVCQICFKEQDHLNSCLKLRISRVFYVKVEHLS